MSNQIYRDRWRSTQRRNGNCIDCGKLKVCPEVRCRTCGDLHNSSQKRYRDERIARGLCRDCGAPATAGTTRCERHAELNALYIARCKERKTAKKGANR